MIVVGLGVAGRIGAGSGAPEGREAAQAAAAVIDAPARTPAATLDGQAPVAPVAIRRRETGTDGLMGRLPFDLPPDAVATRVNRFTIDDVVATWATWDTTPPWVRRLGFMSSHRTDPYER